MLPFQPGINPLVGNGDACYSDDIVSPFFARYFSLSLFSLPFPSSFLFPRLVTTTEYNRELLSNHCKRLKYITKTYALFPLTAKTNF